MNHDPSKRHGNRKVRNAVRATAAAGTLLLAAACTPSNEHNASDRPAPSQAAAPETTTTLSPEAIKQQVEAQAKAYAESQERNQQFADVTAKYGPKIVEAITKGNFGRWDAYNVETNTYRSQKKEAGWAFLSHTSDYGGDPKLRMVSAYVYQKADGSYDLSKGIRAIYVSIEGLSSVSLDEPRDHNLPFKPNSDTTGWRITLGNEDSPDFNPAFPAYDYSSPHSSFDHTSEQLQAIDQAALATLQESMTVLGLDQ